jgi:hypothetical protein
VFQAETDVSIITVADEIDVTLDSSTSFRASSVRLVGGVKTNYTCSFNALYVLNITGSKSFTLENGILNIGRTSSCYFCYVNDSGNLNLSHVEINFIKSMGYFAYIHGGDVTFEYLQINNQNNWTSPLLFSPVSSVSSVSARFFSCIISKCSYLSSQKYAALVFFLREKNYNSITLNVSSSSFQNNIFNLSSIDGTTNHNGGGAIYFLGENSMSGFLLFVFLFYFSFNTCLVFSVECCMFDNCVTYCRRGGSSLLLFFYIFLFFFSLF